MAVTYYVKNLDCADCAARIERRLNQLTSVKYATLNFATLELRLEAEDVEAVKAEIRKVDPDVRLAARSGEPVAADFGLADRLILAAGIPLFAAALAGEAFLSGLLGGWGARLVFGLIWLAAGIKVMAQAARNLATGRIFDENFLMSLATLGALAIDAFSEAAGVMLFYKLGELLESLALARSRRSIAALLKIKPEIARLVVDGEVREVGPESVMPGALVLVRPGERVPLDGTVEQGESWLDVSMLTGESEPAAVRPGAEVFAGTVNGGGQLSLRVLRPFGESRAARILRLVEDAAANKSPTERFITTFARYYTPAVILVSLLVIILPSLLLPGARFQDWLYRGLVVLVVSCPCALVISIPLGYFGGLGGASRRGILIKGSAYMDTLARLKAVAFDKTGTLTEGRLSVEELRPAPGFEPAELLGWAARAEAGSNHPIAAALRRAYGRETPFPDGFMETPGRGIAANCGGHSILAGSAEFLAEHGAAPGREADGPGRTIHVAVDGRPAGAISFSDRIKAGAGESLADLRRLGVRRTVLLSGDRPEAAAALARRLGIEEHHGGLLPEDKLALFEKLKSETAGPVAFAGDGINDAPVLARADVGIAMGGLGSDAAVEAADVVLADDDPRMIATAVRLARRTRRVVFQNIVFAVGVKLFFISVGVAGLAGMWEAVFADVGVALLAVANSLRVVARR